MKIFRLVLAFVFVLGLNMLAGLIGRPLSVKVLENGLNISTLVLVLFIILGLAFRIVYSIKTNKKNFHKTIKELKSDAIKYQDNIESLNKKIKRKIVLIKSYYILIFILLLTSSFTYLSLSFNGLYDFNFLIVINFYTQIGFMLNILNRYEVTSDGYRLEEEFYPVIYGFLNESKEKLNINNKYIIYISVTNFENTIRKLEKNEYNIILGINTLLILNKNELKSILHSLVLLSENKIFNNFYKQEKIDHMLSNRYFESYNFFLVNLALFDGIRLLLVYNFKKYNILNSKHIEIEIDNQMKEYEEINDFSKALIKLRIFDLFYNEPGHDFTIPRLEDPSTRFFEDIYDELLERFKIKHKTYYHIIKNELDHPLSPNRSVNNRLRFFKTDEIEIDYTDNFYDETETREIINVTQRVTDEERQRYYEIRDLSYMPIIRKIENYEQNPKDDLRDLLDYAFDLFRVEKINHAFEVFKYILSKYPDTSQAHFGLGNYYLSYLYDKQGINHIYRAAELNNNYIESLEMIGDFLLKMGLKEEYEEFDHFYLEKLNQKVSELDDISTITGKEKLLKPNLDEKIINEIVEYAKSLDFAKEIFIVRKIINKDLEAHVVCVFPNMEKSLETVELGMDNLFKNLDLREEQYGLTYVPNLIIYKKLKKKFTAYKFIE